MNRQAYKAWHSFLKPITCLSSRHNCAFSRTNTNQIPKNLRFLSLAVLITTSALTGCVGSRVDNALDVAVITPQDQQLTLEETSEASQSLASAVNSGAIPIPENSPLTAQMPAPPTTETALLPQEEKSPLETAAAEVLNTPVSQPVTQPVQVVNAGSTQIASLEPAPDTNTDISASPAVPTASTVPAIATAKPAPAKPKSLFELWFGKKNAKKTTTVDNTIKPGSKTVFASTSSSSSSSLPGVKQNSEIFGINEEEESDDQTSVQVASVGSLGRIISPKGLLLQTERVQVDCFKPELLQILGVVERRYGKKVMVTSGYRSPTGNRRAGGARNSTHIYCKAADIQVEGVTKWDLAKFLRSVPGRGGVGTYCRTESVHIDVGSQRDWHHPCRRSKKKRA